MLNKIDKIEEVTVGRLKKIFDNAVPISALRKTNFEELIDRITLQLSGLVETVEFRIPQARMDLLNMIYEKGSVLSRDYRAQDIIIRAQVPLKVKERITKALKNT
ncbi:MAG: hypothetical protein NTV07_05940 [Candidatus Omnitrophica bacterium]|nr:hypothetical protein [Candidatus Omnitrophota bacterium]